MCETLSLPRSEVREKKKCAGKDITGAGGCQYLLKRPLVPWIRRVLEGDVLVPLHLRMQVQMMSQHKDSKAVLRYNHRWKSIEQNAANSLGYDEE
jgi:hypothetical protein